MRTIDEAITHAREVAERNRNLLNSDELVQKSYDAYFDKLKYEKCAEEHEQLAEWLEELKANKVTSTEVYEQGYSRGYNKAIDDFIHECDIHCGYYKGENKNLTREDILKIERQLKEGVKNVNTSNSKEE